VDPQSGSTKWRDPFLSCGRVLNGSLMGSLPTSPFTLKGEDGRVRAYKKKYYEI